MKPRPPGRHEIDRLIAYLPQLYAQGFQPVEHWEGGTQDEKGIWRLPWPVYHPLVTEFFRLLGAEYWLDYDYDPPTAGLMLSRAGFVERASLEQIKTMLTYCVRGERFSDGHWAEMIENGYVRRLLTRLRELQEHPDAPALDSADNDLPAAGV
jgi:hypothetical protein